MTQTDQNMHRKSQAGFSLVELMVVVFIMGLLATLIIINVAPVGDQSRVTKARADIAALESALEQYSLDMYGYPTSNQGLDALVNAPAGVDAARYRPGGYVRSVRMDPWNNPYVYAVPGDRSGRGYDLYSFGADGEEGGEGLNADIGNWE